MGCGASTPIPQDAEQLERVSAKVAKEFADGGTPTAGLVNGQPAPAAAPASQGMPAAAATTASLAPPPPPATFAEIAAESGGRLPHDELEACMMAIGMTKGVLALATASLSKVTPEEKGYSLAEWWESANPRSRVVIESKLRSSSNPRILVSLPYLCTPEFVVGRPLEASASLSDLRESLEFIGVDGSDLDGLLEGCGETVTLKEWVDGLSEEKRRIIALLLRGDDPGSPVAAARGRESGMLSVTPKELASDIDPSRFSADNGGVPDFDPLANARSAMSQRNTSVTESDVPDVAALPDASVE